MTTSRTLFAKNGFIPVTFICMLAMVHVESPMIVSLMAAVSMLGMTFLRSLAKSTNPESSALGVVHSLGVTLALEQKRME